MDSQRCIHDMVMRFKFVRHFYLKKKGEREAEAACGSSFVLFSTAQEYRLSVHLTISNLILKWVRDL